MHTKKANCAYSQAWRHINAHKEGHMRVKPGLEAHQCTQRGSPAHITRPDGTSMRTKKVTCAYSQAWRQVHRVTLSCFIHS
jgi:hypothetical protein